MLTKLNDFSWSQIDYHIKFTSITQYLKRFNWSKTRENKRNLKTTHWSEIHSAFACSRWPPWFPDLSRPYGACVKRGSGKHVRSQSFSSESAVNYLHVGENNINQMPYPRANKDNQIPTQCHASPPPAPLAGMTLIGALHARCFFLIAFFGRNDLNDFYGFWDP